MSIFHTKISKFVLQIYLLLPILIAFPVLLSAKAIEPRLYNNIPKDLNFFVMGFAYSQGALADDTVPDLVDPKLRAYIGVIGYARSLGIAGKSSKFDFSVPSTCLDGDATYKGSAATRNICGLGDVKARFAINIFGAPALTLKEFASYKQKTVVGLSFQLTAPTGQYDESKLVNISPHRWALKPGIGISQAVSQFIFEFSADIEFYTENSESFAGTARKQAPVYSAQIHSIYTFKPGLWLGLNANFYRGGENTTDGIKKDDALNNARYGATLSFPINNYNSIKLYANSGIFARTGTDFILLGVSWLHRF